jgi:hypothetical protein
MLPWKAIGELLYCRVTKCLMPRTDNPGCFKSRFITWKAYINLYRGRKQYFEI